MSFDFSKSLIDVSNCCLKNSLISNPWASLVLTLVIGPTLWGHLKARTDENFLKDIVYVMTAKIIYYQYSRYRYWNEIKNNGTISISRHL